MASSKVWSEQPSKERNYGTYEVVVAARTDARGQPAGGAIPISGTFESPATRPAVASDGAGAALVAYEKHPESADVPIRIGIRILKK